MFSAATSGLTSRRYAIRFATGTPMVPVEKLITTSTSALIASRIARKSSTS